MSRRLWVSAIFGINDMTNLAQHQGSLFVVIANPPNEQGLPKGFQWFAKRHAWQRQLCVPLRAVMRFTMFDKQVRLMDLLVWF